MTTTLLELAGILALAGFAWFVWPPLVLLVLGVTALLISWKITHPHPVPRRRRG